MSESGQAERHAVPPPVERAPQRGRTGLAATIGLLGLAALTLGPAGLAMIWQDRAEEPGPAQVGYHVGDPVPDGPVTFVVHEVRCGPDDEAAHGRLCEVTLGARNHGEDEVAVPSSAQTLHVSQGARHLPDLTGSGDIGTLEPAEAATAVIRFDLPLEVDITHLEVRADTYGHGVPVAVDSLYPLAGRDGDADAGDDAGADDAATDDNGDAADGS